MECPLDEVVAGEFMRVGIPPLQIVGKIVETQMLWGIPSSESLDIVLSARCAQQWAVKRALEM